jgi:hypothetical protein
MSVTAMLQQLTKEDTTPDCDEWFRLAEGDSD